jgi:NAD-dependent deacetylase
MEILISEAAKAIKSAQHVIAFTGAGISVESGIPPFRGSGGIWNKYDPKLLDIDYYLNNQELCWISIREMFYDFFAESKPNKAHTALAHLEKAGLLKAVITQNIDNLHWEAGNKTVYEFHGNSKKLVCLTCFKEYEAKDFDFKIIPPLCKKDGSILKPDFVFFGEGIPPAAYTASFRHAEICDVCLVIGSTGEVVPASYVPRTAKSHGATIIEVNPEPSHFTNQVTDIFLQGKAGDVMEKLVSVIFNG